MQKHATLLLLAIMLILLIMSKIDKAYGIKVILEAPRLLCREEIITMVVLSVILNINIMLS